MPHAGGRRPGAALRHRHLAQVLDYLRAAEPVDSTIPELCQSLGVSQRSLEYAFRETFDLTPVAFLRLRRLHSARRRLMAADPADMSVADIALQEGFYHLGRFASAYRATLGERPSQTLRRPCPDIPRGLRM